MSTPTPRPHLSADGWPALAPLTTPAPTAQAHGPHVLGVAPSNLAVDGNAMNVDLASPVDSFVGFEHGPRTETQKRSMHALADRFGKPEGLLAMHSDARCQLADGSLGDAPEVAAEAEKGHADCNASLPFRCAVPGRSASVDVVGLTRSVPRIQHVDVLTAVAQGQRQASAKCPQTRLRWGR